MNLTIESASSLLYRMYNNCEERNDKIDAEAIGVALECMRKIEEQKCKDYVAKEKNENIKNLIDSASPLLMSYHLSCLSAKSWKEIQVLKDMLDPLREIVKCLDLLENMRE